MGNKINVKAQAKPNQRVVKVLSGDKVEFFAIGLGGIVPGSTSGGNADVMFGYIDENGMFQQVDLSGDTVVNTGDPSDVDVVTFNTGVDAPDYTTIGTINLYKCVSVGDDSWSGKQVSWNGESWEESDDTTYSLQISGYTPTVGDVYTHDSSAKAILYPDQPTIEIIPTTATAGDILSGKTAVLNGVLTTGTLTVSSGSTSTDLSGVTATAEDVLVGKYFVNRNSQLIEGSIAMSSTNVADNAVYISKGYISEDTTKVIEEMGDIVPTDGKIKIPVGYNKEEQTFTITYNTTIIEPDLSGITVTSADVLKGKKYVNSSGTLMEGSIPTISELSFNEGSHTVTASKGYYASDTKYVIPTGSVSDTGSEVIINKGYINSSRTISLKYPNSADATATADDIRLDRTAYVNNIKISGNMIDAIPQVTDNIVRIPPGYVGPEGIEKTLKTMDIIGPVDGVFTVPVGYNDAEFKIPINGVDTSSATAVSGDIVEGKTAYVKAEKVTGTMPEISTSFYNGVFTISPGYTKTTVTRTVPTAYPPYASGQYVTTYKGYYSEDVRVPVRTASAPTKSGNIVRIYEGWNTARTVTVDTMEPVKDGDILTVPVGYNTKKREYKLSGELSPTTAASGDIVEGKTAFLNNQLTIGSMPKSSLTKNGPVVTATKGYISETSTVTVNKAKAPTVDKNVVTIPEGWHTEDTRTVPMATVNVANGKLDISAGYFDGPYSYDLNGSGLDATATAGDIVINKTAYVGGKKITGSMPKANVKISGGTVTVSKGYVDTATSKSIEKSSGVYLSSDGRTAICGPGYLERTSTYVIPSVSVQDDGNFIIVPAGYHASPARIPKEELDTTDATAVAAHLAPGVTAYARGYKLTGTMPTSSARLRGTKVHITTGYTENPYDVDIPVASSPSTEGNVVTVYEGYLESGETITVGTLKGADTYTPGTTDQVIPAETFLGGDQTIKGDANLSADNIRAGYSIFDVAGSFTSDASAGANDIVAGASAYVNGEKIDGALPEQSAEAVSISVSGDTVTVAAPFGVYRSVRKSEPMSNYCDNPVYASSTIEVDVPDGAYKDGILKTYELSEPCECQDLKSYIVYEGGYLYGPVTRVTNPEEAVEGDILATYDLIQPTYGQEGGHALNPDIGGIITVIKGEGSAIRYTAGGSDLSKSSISATDLDYRSCTIQYDVTVSGTSENDYYYHNGGESVDPNNSYKSVTMIGTISHKLGNLAGISGKVQYPASVSVDPETGKAIIGSDTHDECLETPLPDGSFDVTCGPVTSNILGSDAIYGSDKFDSISMRWRKGSESAPPNTKSPKCGPDDTSCTDPAYVGDPDSSDSYDPGDLMLVFSVPGIGDFSSVNAYTSYEDYDTGNTRVSGFGAPWNWANYDNLTQSIDDPYDGTDESYTYETKWTSVGASSVGIRANAPRGTDLFSNYGIVLGSNMFSSSHTDSFVDERPAQLSSGHTSRTLTGTISISNPILIDEEGNEVVL